MINNRLRNQKEY